MATSVRTEAGAVATAGAAPHYLTFALGAEVFAMDIRGVREIIQAGAMTPVPLMPGFVRGMINLRGAVVPVIDAQARFGRPAATIGKKTCIVIYDVAGDGHGPAERLELGLLVDAVNAVVEIADEAIETAPEFGASVPRDYIRGMGRLGARFVIVLDPTRAFDVDDMAGLCESAQRALPA